MKKMMIVKYIAILFLGFAMGIVCGGFFMHGGPPRWGHNGEMLAKMLTHRLDLDDSQSAQVTAIVKRSAEKFILLKKEIRPRFEEIQNQGRAEIRPLLNDRQREKFDQLTIEMERRRQERFSEEER